jgi:Flp pilus assembly pilin Flp
VRGLISFCKCEQGQDLVEYALMMAFLTLVGAAMFVGMGNTTSSLWSVVNSRLGSNNQAS